MTKKSVLQQARAAYQPKLPTALWGAVKAVEGAATESVADQEQIKKLFPNTYGLPELRFEKDTDVAKVKSSDKEVINVGVILSGGQAPGGHNVISGLFDGLKSLNKANRLYGFLMGPGGLVDHNYMELTGDIIDQYRNTGGFDIIGSGRTKLETVDQLNTGTSSSSWAARLLTSLLNVRFKLSLTTASSVKRWKPTTSRSTTSWLKSLKWWLTVLLMATTSVRCSSLKA